MQRERFPFLYAPYTFSFSRLVEWYDWHLKGKKRPEFLKDRVCYYVMGANQWKYASSLDEVYNDKQTWYLSSDNGSANDVFHSGRLTGNKPGRTFGASQDFHHFTVTNPDKPVPFDEEDKKEKIESYKYN